LLPASPHGLFQQAADHFRPARDIWFSAANFFDSAPEFRRHANLNLTVGWRYWFTHGAILPFIRREHPRVSSGSGNAPDNFLLPRVERGKSCGALFQEI